MAQWPTCLSLGGSTKKIIPYVKENNIDFRNQHGEKFVYSLLSIVDEKYVNKYINDTMYLLNVIEDQITLTIKMIVMMNNRSDAKVN